MDPYGKLHAGAKLSDLSVRFMNRTKDSVKDYLQGVMGEGPARPQDDLLQYTEVRVSNATGAKRDWYEIVELGDAQITVVDSLKAGEIVLAGNVPTDTTKPFAILSEPMLAVPEEGTDPKYVYRAVAVGVTMCKLKVNDLMHRFATSTIGDCTRLTTVEWGAAEILWRSTAESGDVWAVVRLGNTPDVEFYAEILNDTSTYSDYKKIQLDATNFICYADMFPNNRFRYKWREVVHKDPFYSTLGGDAVTWVPPSSGGRAWTTAADFARNTMENRNQKDALCGNGVNMRGKYAGSESLLPLAPGAIVRMRAVRFTDKNMATYTEYWFTEPNLINDANDMHCTADSGRSTGWSTSDK